MWVARDKAGKLFLYYKKPKRRKNNWHIKGTPYLQLDRASFPDLKWEDEPKEVSLVDSEFKDLIISWFECIKSNLDTKFPTRFTEPLEGKRGSELDAVNDEIARCSRCIEFIKKFL